MQQISILRRAVEATERIQAPSLVVGSIIGTACVEFRFSRDIDAVTVFAMKHLIP
jgi:hypothetical protein